MAKVSVPPVPPFQTHFQSSRIAVYKGTAIREWYNDVNFWENTGDKKTLIGLSFEIDSKIPKPINIKVRRIYYIPGDAPYFLPDSPTNRKTLEQEMAYYFPNHPQQETDKPKATELEFYQKIGFIFFTIDQLKPFLEIADETNDLVFSGCEIDFGKMVFNKPISINDNKQQDKYFSLKVEINQPIQEAQNKKIESETIPLTEVGQPCPPHWYPYSAAFKQIYAHADNPEAVVQSSKVLFKSWIEMTNKIGVIKP